MRLDEFSGVNAGYVLELFERYKQNPQSVDPQTREIFESWTPAADEAAGHASTQPARVEVHKIVGAANLADCIRRYGHLAARLDPLGSEPVGDPSLSVAAHGITDADLKMLPASLVGGPVAEASANAYEAIDKLRRIYCSTIGFDYAHIFVPEEREWLRHAAESGRFLPPMDTNSVEAILDRLTQVEVFERFLHRTFPGKTRFSIEGLDMIPDVISSYFRAADAVDLDALAGCFTEDATVTDEGKTMRGHADDAIADVGPERLRNVNTARRGTLLTLVLERPARDGNRNLLRVRGWMRDDEVLAAGFADDTRIGPIAADVLADLSPHAVEDRGAAREMDAREIR